jgi:CBS domain-containing protein
MQNELDEVTVGTIGIKTPFTVSVDASVSKAAEKMLREKVHSIVVVDKNGKLAGMLTSWDILKVTFIAEKTKDMPVSKLIEGQQPMFVFPEVSLRDALNLMVDKNLRALPVVDDSDKLVGKISMTDIAKFVREKL